MRWLREQPLFLMLTNRAALKGEDQERSLALIGAPIFAVVLLVSGTIGAGLSVVSTANPVDLDLTQASEIAEQVVVEETESLIEIEPEPDPIELALEQWGRPDFAAILSEEFPGAQWTLNGDSYSGLTWIGPGAKPTEAELLNLWGKVGKLLSERRTLAEAEAEAKAAEQKAAAAAKAADPTRQELCRAIDYKALYGPGVDYTKVLSVHYPGAQWSLNGDAYSGLTWISPGTKPTKATLDGLWDGVAFQLCLQKPMAELTARAGTSDTEEYVDGVARPKGYSDGTFTPTLANCNQLPQVPNDGGGGSIELMQSPEKVMSLNDLGCRLAEAHGYFGGTHSMGWSLNGNCDGGTSVCTFMWHSSQIDPNTVRSFFTSIGSLTPPPEPEPEPDPE